MIFGLSFLEWGVLFAAFVGCVLICALLTDIAYERSLEHENDNQNN